MPFALAGPLLDGLAATAARMPRLAILLSDVVGWVTVPFRTNPWRQVRNVIPGVSAAGALRVAARAMVLNVRNRVFGLAAMRAPGRLGKLVVPAAVPSGPAILATLHVGPIHAFGVMFGWNAPEASPFLRGSATEELGAATLHRGLAILRDGGIVCVAVDPRKAARIEASFFGAPAGLARGAFALARISGAPIVPLLFVWRGHSIHPVFGSPIDPGNAVAESPAAAEALLAQRLAAWFEDWFREHPGDIGLRVIKRLAVEQPRPRRFR